MRIDIVNMKAIKVAALEHKGDPETLHQSVETFRTWRKGSGCSPVATKRTFGVARSNPEARPAQAFHFDVCGEVETDVPENEYGVINKEIEGGRYGRLRYKGSRSLLNDKANAIFRNWLPASDERKRDAPVFFEYLNITADAPESEMITDIYVPLKACE